MSSAIPNLWPTDLAPTVERTPLTILKEQAAQLGAQTKNLLEGRVETKTLLGQEEIRASMIAEMRATFDPEGALTPHGGGV